MRCLVQEQEGATDPFHVQARGRVLSLELLKVLLDNAGAVFHQRFVGAIKQYLCMSLLKNCSHPTPHSFQVSPSRLASPPGPRVHALAARVYSLNSQGWSASSMSIAPPLVHGSPRWWLP